MANEMPSSDGYTGLARKVLQYSAKLDVYVAPIAKRSV